jgi:hippurate hydrolase
MEENYFPAVWHDPDLTERLRGVVVRLFGADQVKDAKPAMGAEDFGRFGKHYGAPGLQINIGGAPASAGRGGPGLHSSKWAPDPEPTLRTGTIGLTRAVLDFVGRR